MKKKALIVGINDYSQVDRYRDLDGAVNDAEDIANLLLEQSFKMNDITILTDARATADNILRSMTDSISGLQPQDLFVFYYAGHGSRVATFSDSGEVDGKNEILCPYDTSFEEKRYITDDEISSILKNIPSGAVVEFIVDACNSGTVTRGPKIRYLPPPLEYSFYVKNSPRVRRLNLFRTIVTSNLNHIVWTACSEQQFAAEMESENRGVFTYYFCNTIRSNTNITRKELDRIVTLKVGSETSYQTPQLEINQSNIEKVIFT